MTQAIALNEILKKHGHQVVAVLAGRNQHRNLPTFFETAFDVPVTSILSPSFDFKGGRGVSMGGTVSSVLRSLPDFCDSLQTIDRMVRATEPDVIINFLEPLIGIYNLRKRHRIPVIAFGHQFMMEHPGYVKIKPYAAQRFGMKQFVRLVGARSTKMALSFYEAPNLPGKNLFVCPPLLRNQLFELTPNPNGKFVLIYMVNHGYCEDITHWHQSNADTVIHCFYDKPGAPEEESVHPNLTFHKLNGEKFLRMMADSKAVVCTAGFESVSEAAYLGKPLLMTPLENHVEQYINAIDAEFAKLGIWDKGFNISRLLAQKPLGQNDKFKSWVDSAEEVFLRVLNQVTQKSAWELETASISLRNSAGPLEM